MRHEIFGCSAVYDKDFLRLDESGWLGQKMDEICMKVAAFGQEMDNIYIYAKLSWIQPYSCVKGTEFIKLNGENNGVIFYIIGFVVRD